MAIPDTPYYQIDRILWFDWDPIGVNEYEEARDEYHGYIPSLVSLKVKGVSLAEIAALLHMIETEIMGLPGNLERCKKIATMITELGTQD